MRILITGGSGLLGNNLASFLSRKHKIYATYCRYPVNLDKCHVVHLDITDVNQTQKTISALSPHCIIHTAALTNVDYCEEHPKEAHTVNVAGTRNLIDASKDINPMFVYISTSSIYGGEKGMYKETDPVNPQNAYDKSKLDGEYEVSESGLKYSILRTMIYGKNIQKKQSLVEWILQSLQNNKKITLFYDAYFTPIFVNNLSEVIAEIVEKNVTGLFNVGGSERCNKLEFGQLVAEVFGLNRDLIAPISIDEKGFIAKRAKDTSINTDKIQKKINTNLLNVTQGLEWFKKLAQ